MSMINKKPTYEELEEALRESELRYQNLVDGIDIGVSIISPKMEILALNKRMRSWFPQIDPQNKHTCYKAFNNPPRQAPCTYCPTIKTLADGLAHESITSTPSGDGIINFRILSTPIKDKNGEITAAIELVEDVTEKKKYEEDIILSEQKYQNLFNKMLNGFAHHEIITNSAGEPVDYRFLQVNPAFEKLTGLKVQDILGKTVLQIMPETEKYWIEIYGKVALTGEPVSFENYSKALDKYFSVTAYRPAENQFACIFMDITPQKKAELDLKKSNEKLNETKALLEARFRLSELTPHVNLERLMQAAVDEAEKLTGSTMGFFHFVADDQEELILQAWSTNTLTKLCRAEGKGKHYPISKAGVWVDCFRQRKPVIHHEYAALSHKKGLPEGHAPVNCEMTIPIIRGTKVKAIIGVGNKPTPYTDEDIEMVTELASFTNDLIEKKQVEEIVLKERSNFIKTFEAAPVGLLLLDTDMIIRKANKTLTNLVQRDVKEIIGKRAGNGLGCSHSLDSPMGCGYGDTCRQCPFKQSIDEVLACGQGLHGREINPVFLINGRLQERWLRVDIEPIELEGQQYVIVALDDITARKRDEEKLHEFTEKQIILLREVNHRVKNNLTAIISILHQEEDLALDQGKEECSSRLHEVVGRVSGLLAVHTLLSSVKWEPLLLEDLCKNIIHESLKGVPANKSIKVEITPSDIHVNSDQAHYLTIILNELATNSMKYALQHSDTAQIMVSIDQQDNLVHLLFKDDGPGYNDSILRGEIPGRCIGYKLITGIVRKSLRGEIKLSNDGGAAARISFSRIVSS